jgi:trk system potassium uptake protein TrkH
MLISACNFTLYYRLLRGQFRAVARNSELRAYLLVLLLSVFLVTLSLTPVYGSVGEALRYGFFQSASVLSTTGAVTADYTQWPALAKTVLFCLLFVGGCSGSTAGGIKMIRLVILWKQGGSEIKRTLFPRGIFQVRLNGAECRRELIYGTAGFFFLYMITIAAATLVVAASGVDLLSALSASLAICGNVGLGFGRLGAGGNFALFPDHIKWFFSFLMIAGRLELWTMYVLFPPEYWQR